jgi:hypothetical protein
MAFRERALASGLARDPITIQPATRHVAIISAPLAGRGDDAASTGRSRFAGRRSSRRRSRGRTASRPSPSAGDSVEHGPHRHAALTWADRVRVRSGVRPAAGDVPLGRDPAGGDRAQPPVGRRRVRVPRRGLQWGWGEKLLGFKSTGGIMAWVPLFVFVVLFGLSKLLGEWNWWLPRPLHRLPRIAVEPATQTSR